jgi:hypothetical protein
MTIDERPRRSAVPSRAERSRAHNQEAIALLRGFGGQDVVEGERSCAIVPLDGADSRQYGELPGEIAMGKKAIGAFARGPVVARGAVLARRGPHPDSRVRTCSPTTSPSSRRGG